MLKLNKKIVIVAMLFFIVSLLSYTKVNAAERISWNGKMNDGKNIYYWIDSSCQYTATIPQAVSKLRYPSGLWNPMVLNKTTTKSYSKMDFYQYYDVNTISIAGTIVYPAKINGQEQNPLTLNLLDSTNWQYAKIRINDGVIYPPDKNGNCAFDPDLLSTLILHEICHAYGGKDVYDNVNTIMFGRDSIAVRSLTSDFNDVLVQKYNY